MSKVQTSLRLEEETFNEAKEILKSLGMNFTEAVNVFASMVVQEKGLPFDVVASQYPSLTYEEAQEKVKRSIKDIAKGKGVPSDDFFTKLLAK
jgi:DNA-damage-inducible protein J